MELQNNQAGQGSPSSLSLKRILNYWDVVAVMVGIIVGSGIFITPSIIARNVPSLAGILGLWVAGGLLSLFGAMAYAELGAALPQTGGHYAFAREAFGPLVAFLFGWAYLLIGYPCSLAGIAAIFGLYASQFVPLGEMGIRFTAAGAILLVAGINYLGVRESGWVQRVFAYGKVAVLLAIVLAGFLLRRGSLQMGATWGGGHAPIGAGAIVAALVGVMWTYDGWCDATPVAGEVQRPGRDMGKSLLFGMLAVIMLYAVVNLAYIYLLPLKRIAASPMVAADAAEVIFGAAGASLISALILASTFGALNGNMIAAPRVYFAMARDGVFFRKVGQIHPRFGTPHYGILTTLLMSVLYVLSGTFEQIINYFIFVSWIFYIVNVAGLMVLRRRRPEMPRPFRAWGYPWTPAFFILAGIFMLVNIYRENPLSSGAGLVLVLTGVPVYFWWRRRSAVRG